MSTNLNKEESLKKMRELVDDIKIAMMVTGFDRKPFNAIPMRAKKVDEQGNIYFLSLKNSEHNLDLEKSGKVQLLFSDNSDMEFLSLYGSGKVTTDQALINDLYSSTSDNWFEGKDDPNITVIKVAPEEAYYWDTKSNKYVSLLKMGIGAVTGDKMDIGEKGKLNL